MASFTTRVELHDAEWEDYEELHKEMKRYGFLQSVTSDGNITYELPPAEYNFIGDVTRAEVLASAKAAAASTGKEYGILVTESNGRTWHGLKIDR